MMTFAISAYLVTTVAAAGQCERNDGVELLYGIKSTFNAISDKDNNLRLDMTLKNIGNRQVKFRYSACLIEHIQITDQYGTLVSVRDDARLPNCPLQEVTIEANRSISVSSFVALSEYFELPSGLYRIRLKYDRRLMEDTTSNRPFTTWGRSAFVLKSVSRE